MTSNEHDRNPLLALVVFLGLGLLAAAYAVWTLEAQVRMNQQLLRQQQQTATGLIARDAENTQALQEQLRLVQGLQQQVRQLGGTPLLQPPSPAATPRSSPSSAAAPTPQRTPAAQRPSATPRPTPRPTRSPAQSPTPPAPSPSPTCTVKVGPVCL